MRKRRLTERRAIDLVFAVLAAIFVLGPLVLAGWLTRLHVRLAREGVAVVGRVTQIGNAGATSRVVCAFVAGDGRMRHAIQVQPTGAYTPGDTCTVTCLPDNPDVWFVERNDDLGQPLMLVASALALGLVLLKTWRLTREGADARRAHAHGHERARHERRRHRKGR